MPQAQMHPPVEESILHNNPQFAALYKTLTSAVLNPDCSTKNDPAGKDREAVKEELKRHRLKTIRRHLLISAISTANPSESPPKPTLRRPGGLPQPPPSAAPSLPPDLLTLLVLLPPLLSTPSHQLFRESTSLLLSNPPFTALPSLLPALAPSISSALVSGATALARLLNPSTNPSFIHRAIPALPTSAASLLAALSASKRALARARSETAAALTAALLSQRARAALELLVRGLESKHGNQSRHLELRAAEMALSAAAQERAAARLVASAAAEVYAPAAAAALRRYADHLRDAKARLREDVAALVLELRRYGVRAGGGEDGEGRSAGRGGGGGGKGDEVRERTMREMARVYRDMGRQIEEVRGDLERLGRA